MIADTQLRRGVPIFYVAAFALTASIVLGGGTRPGILSDAVLQFLCVPLFLCAVWHTPLKGRFWSIAFCALLALIPLLQCIPLPPVIAARWLATSAGGDLRSLRTISLDPNATILAALSLLPPITVFLAVIQLRSVERRSLSLVLLVVAGASVFLGLLQVAQGELSPLRFYEITNPSEAVGFFANRNHFAALLFCLIPLAAAWMIDANVEAARVPKGERFAARTIVPLAASFTILVVVVAAQTTARSRAGLGLTIAALFAAFLLSWPNRLAEARGIVEGRSTGRVLIGAIALAVLMGLQFSLYRIMDRFGGDPLADARIPFARNTIAAAKAFMPFGSGMGSFVPVYARFEPPADVLADTYANRAHNDVLELWLEGGILTLLMMGIFGIWFLGRALVAWRGAPVVERAIDFTLPRAATIIITLLIAHSMVDYPLRTGAMMAVFALACGLLMPADAEYLRAEHARNVDNDDPAPAGPKVAPEWSGPETVPVVRSRAAVDWPSRQGAQRGDPVEVADKVPKQPGRGGTEWPEAWRGVQNAEKAPSPRVPSWKGGDDT